MNYKEIQDKLNKELFETDEGFLMKVRRGILDKEQYKRVKELISQVYDYVKANNVVDKDLVSLFGLINNTYYDIFLGLSQEGNETLDEIMNDFAKFI